MTEVERSLAVKLLLRGRVAHLLLKRPDQRRNQSVFFQFRDGLRHLLQAAICLHQLIAQSEQNVGDIRRFGPGNHGNHGQIQRIFIEVRLDKSLQGGEPGLAQELLTPGKVRPKALLLQAQLVENDRNAVRMEGAGIQLHVEQPVVFRLRLCVGEVQQVSAVLVFQLQLQLNRQRGLTGHVHHLNIRQVQIRQLVTKALLGVVPEHQSVVFGEKSLLKPLGELFWVHEPRLIKTSFYSVS